jgi:hypothetical protein
MPRAKCPDCGEKFGTTDAYPFCPECGSQNAHLVSESVTSADDGIDWSEVFGRPVPTQTARQTTPTPRCGQEMSNGDKCVLPAGHAGPHKSEVGDDGE